VNVLTPRQRVINHLVHRGMTSQQIADELGISRRTVEVHRAHITSRILNSQGQRDNALQQRELRRVLMRLSSQVAAIAAELKVLRAVCPGSRRTRVTTRLAAPAAAIRSGAATRNSPAH
jgi:orotate phosphoribosyltransferase-like protein